MAYTATEAASASPLQTVVRAGQSLAVFSPWKELTGRPLIGNGTNAAAGSGQAGGSGGWLSSGGTGGLGANNNASLNSGGDGRFGSGVGGNGYHNTAPAAPAPFDTDQKRCYSVSSSSPSRSVNRRFSE